MDPGSAFTKCGRHPSQIFTGFCSLCLMERLSSVENVQRSPRPFFDYQQKEMESSTAVTEHNRYRDVRERNTLLSLFHLDDVAVDKNEKDDGVEFADCRNRFENVSVREDFDSVTHVGRNGNGSENACNGNAGDHSLKSSSMRYGNPKDKCVSFWLSTVFSRKILRWRTISAYKKASILEKNWDVGFDEKESETKAKCRRSYDQKEPFDSNNGLWEDPRQSWDSFIMAKAVTGSFTGVEETLDGKSMKPVQNEWRKSPISHVRKRSMPEMDPRSEVDAKDMNNACATSSAEEKPMSVHGNSGECIGDVHYEEPYRGISVLNIRRRSHGWSRVWNNSITSPFRDFIQRRENVLERSLSESWQELRGEKNVESTDADGRVHHNGTSFSASKRHQFPNRSKSIFNSDCQKKGRNSMLGRSRSVHYPSPGDLDNGLLRFYLTPLRTSRRATGKSRTRSWSFARDNFVNIRKAGRKILLPSTALKIEKDTCKVL